MALPPGVTFEEKLMVSKGQMDVTSAEKATLGPVEIVI